MSAFKAANPGCLLEDFVRWYSPADWIVETEGQFYCLDHTTTFFKFNIVIFYIYYII